MLKVTSETKAVLTAERGRVVGFVKSDEPRMISLAVPAERAVLNPRQAVELARWLMDAASEADKLSSNGKPADWLSAERALQTTMLRGRG